MDYKKQGDNNNYSWKKIKGFLIKNFLPIGLLLALIIGLAWPVPGVFLASLKVTLSGEDYSIIKTLNVCIIFFVSGLTLKTSEIKAAITAYWAFLYALVAILLITPLAGFVALEIPFDPQEFAIGLAVFCAVPTTLTSGATLVMQANGNYALALMITVCSNVLGVVTAPFLLKAILKEESISIDAVQLLVKLLCTILLPLVLGKIIRHTSQKILRFGKNHKVELSLINNGSLIMIVWQLISQSRESIVNTRFSSILLLILCGILLHAVYLMFNLIMTHVGRWEKEEQRAVLLLASQKTLPVSVTIISYFGTSVGDKGLIALPCIIGHLSQLFIDTFIVSAWNAKDQKLKTEIRQQELADQSSGDVYDMEVGKNIPTGEQGVYSGEFVEVEILDDEDGGDGTLENSSSDQINADTYSSDEDEKCDKTKLKSPVEQQTV